MSPFGIIALVFGSIIFVVFLMTAAFFAGAGITKSHYKNIRIEENYGKRDYY